MSQLADLKDSLTGLWSDDDEAPEISQDDLEAMNDKWSIDGVVDAAKGVATNAAKHSMINALPGAGVLFQHDIERGFSFTSTGRWLLAGAAAYGVWRFMGRR